MLVLNQTLDKPTIDLSTENIHKCPSTRAMMHNTNKGLHVLAPSSYKSELATKFRGFIFSNKLEENRQE